MRGGRFKVFDDVSNDWWEEFRLYHRKDGRVVKENDEERPGPLVALGGRYGATSGFAIYKNLEIRRLTERPKDLDGPAPQAKPKKGSTKP